MKDKITSLATAGFFAVLLMVLPLSGAQVAEAIENKAEQLEEAQDTVNEAAKVAQQMTADPELVRQIKAAKGLFIIPHYGRAALGVGGSGGEGVLLMHRRDQWSSPMFYNLGGISAGAEAGIEFGPMAMLLMSDKAVQSFMTSNNFSLNADAGFTLLDYSEHAQGSYGKGDILLWSHTEGVFVDLAINVEDVIWDAEENSAYYGTQMSSPSAIVKGDIRARQGGVLQKVLP